MLALDQTALMLDALRPPPGMEIDAAVGTTFTLDLAALLAIPVAASFDAVVPAAQSEPADLLETIRRYADRTVLFCQAGAISVPPQYRAAMTFVEQSVVEVGVPRGGIFHPKTWVVRFAGVGPPRHRVLVMSRNLTYDRAWDVVVRLDEDPGASSGISTAPLASFMNRLPTMAVRSLTPVQRDLLTDLSGTLRDVSLAVPEPFTSGRIVVRPPGRGGRRGTPFRAACDSALAVSPFLTGDAVRELAGSARHGTSVVSRPTALDAVAEHLDDVDRALVLKDAVLDADDSVEGAFTDPADEGEDSEHENADARLRGLHAKVFVQDHGDAATVWLGSANLTAAAFSINVEVLVELTGPVRAVGVDAVLSREPRADNLSWLVEEYEPRATSHDDTNDEEIPAVERRAYEIAARTLTLTLDPDGDRWAARLDVGGANDRELAGVSVALLTQPADSRPLGDDVVRWDALAGHHITPFLVLTVEHAGARHRLLVRAELVGDPEGRRSAVLAQAIGNRDDFMRYLAALLGVPLGVGSADGDGFGRWADAGLGSERVLEDLLTTASRSPARLVSLEHTLRHLEQDPRFAEIVPAEFTDLWRAVYDARRDVIR